MFYCDSYRRTMINFMVGNSQNHSKPMFKNFQHQTKVLKAVERNFSVEIKIIER